MYRKISCISMMCLLILMVLSSSCMAGKLVNASGVSNKWWEEGRIHADEPERYERNIITKMEYMGKDEIKMSKIAAMIIALANENIEYDNKYIYNYVEGKLDDVLDKYDYSENIKNIKLDRIQFCQPIPELNKLPIKNKEIIEYFNQEKKYRDKRKAEAHSEGMKISLIELYNIINNPNKEAASSIDRVIEVDYALGKLESPYWEGIEQNGIVSSKSEIYADPTGMRLTPKQYTCMTLAAHIFLVNQKMYRKAPASPQTVSAMQEKIAVLEEIKKYISSDEFLPNMDLLSAEEKEKFRDIQSIMLSSYTSDIDALRFGITVLNEYDKISDPLSAIAYTLSKKEELQNRHTDMKSQLKKYDSLIEEIKQWR